MRITFVLPFVHPGGGVRVVFEHARGLELRGHSVRIVYPGPTGIEKTYSEPERSLRAAKYYVDAARGKQEYAWFGHPLHVRRVPDLSARHIPDADIIIATSNESADWVVKYPGRCGKKVYFIQDYETWSREPSKVDATWKYPMARITISQWLYDLGVEKFAVPMFGPVPNGVDPELFYPDPPTPPSQRLIDVLMIYRAAPQKGCERALAILRTLKQKSPHLQFEFFGRDNAPKDLLDLGEYRYDPTQADIRHAYSRARIFLMPSFQEGFCLPPMEAALCGCCLVATRVGVLGDIFDNTNASLVSADDTTALQVALEKLVLDKPQCDTLAQAAQSRLGNYTWERATDMLEEILEKILCDA